MSELAWDYPDPFVLEVDVTASDIDDLGHANNTAYLRWCERVGWAHSNAAGLEFAQWRELNRAMAIHEAHLKYIAATRTGDHLFCADWIVTCDQRLRATRHFQFIRSQDGATVFRADFDYVCIDLESGRPRRMPPAFVDAYVVLPSVAAVLIATEER